MDTVCASAIEVTRKRKTQTVSARMREMLPYPVNRQPCTHPCCHRPARNPDRGRPRAEPVGAGRLLHAAGGIDAAKAAGFEVPELSEIAGLSDADFEQAAARIQRSGFQCPARTCSCRRRSK